MLDFEHKERLEFYSSMNWARVCTVKTCNDGTWFYENIDKSLMFSEHSSWLYCITLDGVIKKIGESGQPLGIPDRSYYGQYRSQPVRGSRSRLGRYIAGTDTDKRIRDALNNRIANGGIVEFWAIPCPEAQVVYKMLGEAREYSAQIHKKLEKDFLDVFRKQTGCYPELNCGRA
jgi:hypothetical protein